MKSLEKIHENKPILKKWIMKFQNNGYEENKFFFVHIFVIVV